MGSFIQKVFLIIGVTLIGGGKQRATRGGVEGYLFTAFLNWLQMIN
jgi:hypothetical protein